MRIGLLVAAATFLAAVGVGAAVGGKKQPGKRDALRVLSGLTNAQYRTSGRYVGPADTNVDPPAVILGPNRLPLVKYDGIGYQTNPVTIAQFGLRAFSRGDIHNAVRSADWLVSHQQPDGRWLYHFNYRQMHAPWSSALAQGQAMSLLARIYRQTGRSVYIESANRAVIPLTLSVTDGGLRRCFRGDCRYPFFEEYPTTPPSYVLNGFMFTLVGLYDLGNAGSKTAMRLYRQGVSTLHVALPLYDRDSGNVYALGDDSIASPAYQAIHVYLLRTLFQLSSDRLFASYAAKWRSSLEG